MFHNLLISDKPSS